MEKTERDDSIGNAQRKGSFMYVDGQWYWVPKDFELVYKNVTINGSKIPFPFGFRPKKPEKCEIN